MIKVTRAAKFPPGQEAFFKVSAAKVFNSLRQQIDAQPYLAHLNVRIYKRSAMFEKTMSPRECRWFNSLLAFVEHGTMARAAEVLHYAQAGTIRDHIVMLENQYGQLLRRDRKGIRTNTLNEFGTGFVARHKEEK